ncbi:hypothetical protein EXT46_14865 [Pseudoalteromonas sp. CO325X]|uniref:hypothetical protein n=1 Tax=Pseudoalteromonas sp. CO325X TaxID=1777262 RepID=UPI001023464D|nr:hypothetical protein [Pseudoalteromonas sp. CO325X]RZF79171.1 hypothetical protein EXT46_14865 [Pseudoalteromonas sp. CO325X]
MKSIDKTKFFPSVAQAVNVVATYSKAEGLKSIANGEQGKKRIGRLCLLMPDAFLRVTRTLKASNPIDLLKLAKLESKRVSPFPAHVCWQAMDVQLNQVTVEFYCIPLDVYKTVSGESEFIYPVTDSRSAAETLIVSADKKPLFSANCQSTLELLKSTPAWCLVGLRTKESRSSSKSLLTWKQSLFAGASVIAIYMALTSFYLSHTVNSLEQKIAEQSSSVDEALEVQRLAKSFGSDFEQLQKFMKNNTSALPVLSSFELEGNQYTLNRIEVFPNTLALYGETRGSATELLQSVTRSKNLAEVKFGLPVNNRRGKELFIIEAERVYGKD